MVKANFLSCISKEFGRDELVTASATLHSIGGSNTKKRKTNLLEGVRCGGGALDQLDMGEV